MSAWLDAAAFAAGITLAGFLFGLGFLASVEVWDLVLHRREGQ